MKKHWVLAGLTLLFAVFLVPNVAALTTKIKPARVEVGVWLVNVEKVDLSANSYRLDFYLWFKFNPSEISLDK